MIISGGRKKGEFGTNGLKKNDQTIEDILSS